MKRQDLESIRAPFIIILYPWPWPIDGVSHELGPVVGRRFAHGDIEDGF